MGMAVRPGAGGVVIHGADHETGRPARLVSGGAAVRCTESEGLVCVAAPPAISPSP